MGDRDGGGGERVGGRGGGGHQEKEIMRNAFKI